MRAVVTIATLAGVCIAALASSREQVHDLPVADSPKFQIEVTGSRVRVSGPVSSFAHEAILRQTLLNRFPNTEAEVQLKVAPALPPGWALVTELTVAAMAETRSGSASVDPARIVIRAITSDESRWANAAARLENNLLPAMQFDPQVAEIRHAGPLERQCLELFRTAMRGRRIEFAVSSADLRSSAAPMLDELVQIATDCPDGHIVIVGHTDASGQESGNLALSQARADAVATYFENAGIDPERLAATGVGSSRPIVQGRDLRARRLNRRIEIDIRFP
jgi:OOP family OmpA-OmpF porin